MTKQHVSPEIKSIKWGKVETADGNTYKDVKLFPGGSREWDWNETGTSHRPGIQPADVEELIEHDAEAVVLSKGFHERLQVMDETIALLEREGISCFQLQTEKAVEKYNSLCTEKPAGALIHSTC